MTKNSTIYMPMLKSHRFWQTNDGSLCMSISLGKPFRVYQITFRPPHCLQHTSRFGGLDGWVTDKSLVKILSALCCPLHGQTIEEKCYWVQPRKFALVVSFEVKLVSPFSVLFCLQLAIARIRATKWRRPMQARKQDSENIRLASLSRC